MKTKICSRCKEDRPVELFHKNIRRKDKLHVWCKICASDYKKSRPPCTRDRREYFKTWMRKYRKTEKNKQYEKSFRDKYHSSFLGVASALISGAKARAKNDEMEFDLDREWLIPLMKEMKCSVTGVELTLDVDGKNQHTPFKPSLDRIDNSKGYTKDNTRVVSVMYNKMKSDCTDEDTFKLLNAWRDKCQKENIE